MASPGAIEGEQNTHLGSYSIGTTRIFNPTLTLVALTVGGAILRLFHLGTKSLWMDEIASLSLARMAWHQFAWVWWLQEGNMTAYYLLLRPWLHFGHSEWWIRLLSVIFGVAALPAMFFLARRISSPGTALMATALLAVSPAHVYYSQEARSYSLAIFLVLLSSCFFVRALQDARTGDWVWWTVFSSLAVYAHYFAALVLVAQVVSLPLLRPGTVPWRRVAIFSVAIFLLCLPGISFVFLRGGSLKLHWIPSPTPKEIVHLWMFLGGSGPKFIISILLWICGIAALFIAWRRTRQSEETWHVGLIVLWALLPVAITAAASLRHSVFAQKYLLICLPATVMLAAVGAATLRVKHAGLLLVCVLCALSIATDIRAAYKPREDWRGAIAMIVSQSRPGDAVVFYPFYARIALDYYGERYRAQSARLHVFAPPFYGAGEDQHNLEQALARGDSSLRHVWVVLGPDVRNGSLQQRDPVMAAAMSANFPPPKIYEFQDMVVEEYER